MCLAHARATLYREEYAPVPTAEITCAGLRTVNDCYQSLSVHIGITKQPPHTFSRVDPRTFLREWETAHKPSPLTVAETCG
jgi:hypothetical protein